MSASRDAAEIPTLDARVAALEEQMAVLRPRRRVYRDVWLFAVTGLVVLALANQQSTTSRVDRNQHANTVALCSFKNDLRKRAEAGVEFLKTHPNGFPGISAATIRVGIMNQEATLNSLSALDC